MSLNEYQIKKQSTKNATESTVSLGEKSRSYRCLEKSEIGGAVLAVYKMTGDVVSPVMTRKSYILHPFINFSRFIFDFGTFSFPKTIPNFLKFFGSRDISNFY